LSRRGAPGPTKHALRPRPFFAHQFNRNCMPDGPAIGSIGLSPRGAWQMPSDASSALWLRAVEEMEKAMKEGEK